MGEDFWTQSWTAQKSKHACHIAGLPGGFSRSLKLPSWGSFILFYFCLTLKIEQLHGQYTTTSKILNLVCDSGHC
jgi:hypothetical protein